MIETITCHSTIIGIGNIVRHPDENRRAAERRSALEVLRTLTGDRCLEISHNPNGAPFITGAPHIFISISHSSSLVAVAIDNRRPVGIDIEENRSRQLAKVAPRVLNEAELEYYSAMPGGLLAAWTMKEALFKIAPDGTAADFRHDIALPLSKGDSRASAGQRDAEIALSIARPGYQLTLAVI